MNIRTACCVSISRRHRPVTLLASRLAPDRVTVEAPSTEDVGAYPGGDTGGSCCKHLPESIVYVICIWSRLHGGQSRRANGGRKNGERRSGKATFSKEE